MAYISPYTAQIKSVPKTKVGSTKDGRHSPADKSRNGFVPSLTDLLSSKTTARAEKREPTGAPSQFSPSTMTLTRKRAPTDSATFRHASISFSPMQSTTLMTVSMPSETQSRAKSSMASNAFLP